MAIIEAVVHYQEHKPKRSLLLPLAPGATHGLKLVGCIMALRRAWSFGCRTSITLQRRRDQCEVVHANCVDVVAAFAAEGQRGGPSLTAFLKVVKRFRRHEVSQFLRARIKEMQILLQSFNEA